MEALKEVVFHLTGFGKFNGVSDNPTSSLMKRLPVYLSQQKQQLGLILRVASYTVLEVSADGASDQLRVIQNSGSNAALDGITVYVHFGVSASSSSFCIEECAYNEATFNVPDEKGHTPSKMPIIPQNGPITHCYKSNLPVQWIYETLKTAGWGDCVEYSQDPGRFVCNYVYYKNLDFCEKSTDKRCIFIHCPPLSVLCIEDQLCFVKDCLIVIADSLVKGIQRLPSLAPERSISEKDATVMALMTMGFDIDAINHAMVSTNSTDLDITYAALMDINDQQISGANDWVPSPLPPLVPRSNSTNLGSPYNKISNTSTPNEGAAKRHSPTSSSTKSQGVVKTVSNSGPHRILTPSLSQKNMMNQQMGSAQPSIPQVVAMVPTYDGISARNASSLPLAIIQQHQHESTQPVTMSEIGNFEDDCSDTMLGRPMAQPSKILLVVRQDLNLSPGEITQQCIQASVRATRALQDYDSMAVRQWMNDGDQVIMTTVPGEKELENILQHASDLLLPSLSLLAHDAEDNPIGIAAIGPSPVGILQELSAGLTRYP